MPNRVKMGARVFSNQRERFQAAAELQGISLNDFIVTACTELADYVEAEQRRKEAAEVERLKRLAAGKYLRERND